MIYERYLICFVGLNKNSEPSGSIKSGSRNNPPDRIGHSRNRVNSNEISGRCVPNRKSRILPQQYEDLCIDTINLNGYNILLVESQTQSMNQIVLRFLFIIKIVSPGYPSHEYRRRRKSHQLADQESDPTALTTFHGR